MQIDIPYLAEDPVADAPMRLSVDLLAQVDPKLRFVPIAPHTLDRGSFSRVLGDNRVLLARPTHLSHLLGTPDAGALLGSFARKWELRSFPVLDTVHNRARLWRLSATLISEASGAEGRAAEKAAVYALTTAHLKAKGTLTLVRDGAGAQDAALSNAVRARLREFPDTVLEELPRAEVVMRLVQQPRASSVLLSTAASSELLAPLYAALVGGPAYLPSAVIGETASVFGPCDLGGSSVEALNHNPTSILLSCAMLLRYLGEPQLAARVSALAERTVFELSRVPDLGAEAPAPTLARFADAARVALAPASSTPQ